MIRLADLLQATGGRIVAQGPSEVFSGFAFDSRATEPGQLFVAVVTETGDGHDYIPQACAAGATGVLCERPPLADCGAVTIVQVASTREALLAYARYILAERRLEVVGVTGSVGKTTTKEAIASVLSEERTVFRNPASYNGRFGLPIALGGLEPGQEIAVLEMACDALDEIRYLAEITRPRLAVVTRIGHSHLDAFGSLETIAREKGRLVEALPTDGLAILNADDPWVAAMAKRTRARVVTIGCHHEADYMAQVLALSPEGTRLLLRHAEGEFEVFLPLIGAHFAYSALAAAAVGRHYGLSWEAIGRGLAKVPRLPGRMAWALAVGGANLLDDSHSASLESALAALEALATLKGARRILFLGDIDGLGAHEEETYRAIGYRAAEVADLLVAKGEGARLAAQAAIGAGMPSERVHLTYAYEDALRLLQGVLQEGDLLLVKGGASARLERVTQALLRDPATASHVLPRQEGGWRHVRLQRPGRPTWVEIDLDAIAGNVRRLRQIVTPQAQILAVLKADAYGHGASKVARVALNNGATWLGVACLGEALTLREQGIEAPILVLGFTPAWQARQVVQNNISATVFSTPVAEALSQAARDLGRPARVHIKVDTGMGRLGLLPEEVLPFMREIARLPALEIEGIFSHLAAADEEDLTYTHWQIARFEEVLRTLEGEGLRPPLAHIANSAAALRLREAHYDMVRIGIALYGLSPSACVPLPEGFRPALSFKCQVAQVKSLPEGSFVGYGRTFRTSRPSRIAVIPVGYADGFRRAPRHWGEVLVRGRRAPLVGRVSMDQATIDVTDIPDVRQGDEVVLIGEQGGERITVEEVAERLGTIHYEVISEILARVPRVV